MICLETQHFNINRMLLLIVGLWPYQRSFLIELQLILFFGILITFIVFQLTTFITSECTLGIINKVLSSSFFFICLLIEYNSFWINTDILKIALKQLQEVCNEIKNKNEIAIIKKYGSQAKCITIGLILLVICFQFIFILLYIWPYIRHIMILNNSQSHSPPHIITEYFIDQEKYSYLITVHRHAACLIGSLAMLATGTMLITYVQHICAMFSIACNNVIDSYRIKLAIDISHENNSKNDQKSYKDIIHAINIHRNAIKLLNILVSNFQGSYIFLIAAGTISASCNLFRFMSFISIEQLILSLLFLSILYVYSFISNYMAQQITDHHEYIFITVYTVRWYMAPIHIQKMVLFLLQRGIKSLHVTLGGIFVGSIQSFASLTSTSISYFTVLYSTMHD
ncbi:uncharacterized protein LOC109609779 [Camponotus floridanus]|uniref:uncharacterized protein LOC109609779 n=1 Tax=Camponotus floridanus TaxID=104421 RepID=UPI000DC6930D|nr:uncharacterized protein LOC109609779 [Camponotus floridanus]